MPFQRIQKVVSFGLVLVGLLLLVFSGELSLPVQAIAFGALGIGWWRFGPRDRSRGATFVWNATLVLLFLLLVGLAFTTGNWLLHMIHFGIVMTVSKLFWIQRARDLLQLYALSFLLVLGSAVVNPGLSFATLFPLYVVLLTWGLILVHLRRDLEEQEAARLAAHPAPGAAGGEGDAPLWKTRALITRRFLLGTSLLALAIFSSSLVIFFLFPRLGLGFFHAKTRGLQAVSGFGDDVELGHFGTIRDNDAVVLRVELPDEPPQPGRRLRLRGISFDIYDGKGWHKSERGGQLLHSGPGGFYDARPSDPDVDPSTLLRQEIYVEPLDTERKVVFGVPRVRFVRRPGAKLKELQERGAGGRDVMRLRFVLDRAGDVGYSGGQLGAALRYTVLSDLRPPVPSAAQASARIPPSVLERYLQLPSGLDPRIPALAARLTRDASTPFDQANALERALQSGWTYSLEGGHDPADPLADFLFDRREGHCEYFATAMAVLARHVGLPARVVNGFYGGVWNRFGNYHAIRQADAHSWVEVYFAGVGWLTFDPTPASGRYAGALAGFLSSVDEWVDSLRLRWYKWIIEYDLDKQLGLLRDLFAFLEGPSNPFGDLGSGLRIGKLKEGLKDVFTVPRLLVVGAFLLAAVVAVRLLRRRRAQPRTKRPRPPRGAEEILRLFDRLERRMGRRGYARDAAVSPREWATGIAAEGHPAAAAITAATRAVEEVVWGRRPYEGRHRAALRAALQAVRDGSRAPVVG